jgi:hypothetical protein
MVLFEQRGYDPYNIHKIDRAGEAGVDIECTRKGETEKLLIAVKKRPSSKDIAQLNMFANYSHAKIYVYAQPPTTRFRAEMSKLRDKVSFWDSDKLSSEIFSTNSRLYIFLVLENGFVQGLFQITLDFCRIYFDLEKHKRQAREPVKADLEMLNLLWNAKDRSASLNKSFSSLQTFFEQSDLSGIDEKTEKSITHAYFALLSKLCQNSLVPLKKAFSKFILKYPGNFEKFCVQTTDGSNWFYFLQNLPDLTPGYVIKTIEKERKDYEKTKDFLEKIGTRRKKTEEKENIGEILADVSRRLSANAYWLEDTVDDLFSIGLLGAWDSMRNKFARNEDHIGLED